MVQKGLKRIVLPAAIYLVLLVVAPYLLAQFPRFPQLSKLLEHAETGMALLTIIGIVSMVVEDIFKEVMVHAMRDGLGEGVKEGMSGLQQEVKTGLNSIQTFLSMQLGPIGAEILQAVAEARRPRTAEGIKKYPDTAALIKRGEIKQAISLLEERLHTDPSVTEELVEVFIMSKDVADWEKGSAILHADASMLRHVPSLARNYWSVGNLDKALELVELGLERCRKLPESEDKKILLGKFTNSLAYYLADQGKPENEERARQLIEEALSLRPGDPTVVDTKGYVKISFGKTRQEILEGISICEDARRDGERVEVYFKAIGKARERLEKLEGRK